MENNIQKNTDTLGVVFDTTTPTKNPSTQPGVSSISKNTQQNVGTPNTVFDISQAFSSKHISEGTIISDRRKRRSTLGDNFKSAFKEWWQSTRQSIDKAVALVPEIKKVEDPVIPPVSARTEIVKEAALHTHIAPQDDHKTIIKQFNTLKNDVDRLTGVPQVTIKESPLVEQPISSWVHKIEHTDTKQTPLHTPDMRSAVIAPVISQKTTSLPKPLVAKFGLQPAITKSDSADKPLPKGAMATPIVSAVMAPKIVRGLETSTPSSNDIVENPTPLTPTPETIASHIVTEEKESNKGTGWTHLIQNADSTKKQSTPSQSTKDSSATTHQVSEVPKVTKQADSLVMTPSYRNSQASSVPQSTQRTPNPLSVPQTVTQKFSVSTSVKKTTVPKKNIEHSQSPQKPVVSSPQKFVVPPKIVEETTEQAKPLVLGETPTHHEAEIVTPQLPTQLKTTSIGWTYVTHEAPGTQEPVSQPTVPHVPIQTEVPVREPVTPKVPSEILSSIPEAVSQQVVHSTEITHTDSVHTPVSHIPSAVTQRLATDKPQTFTVNNIHREHVEERVKQLQQIAKDDQSFTVSPKIEQLLRLLSQPFVLAILGIGFVFVLSIGTYFLFQSPDSKDDTQDTLTTVSFFEVSNSVPIPLSEERGTFFMIVHTTLQERGDQSTQVYPTITEGKTLRPATVKEFFEILALSAPRSLTDTLDNAYMLGTIVTTTSEPYLIIRSYNFESLFAGLLAWEKNIQSDFAPLFGIPQTGSTLFTDAVKDNKSTRILYDAGGNEVLVYSFVNRNTVIITTSAEALATLIAEF